MIHKSILFAFFLKLKLQGIIRNQTSMGQRHKDTRMTGSVIKENAVLNEFFFGKSRDELLHEAYVALEEA